MRFWLVATTVLFLATAAYAAPPELKIPPETKGQPGDFVIVRAETAGKTVVWYILDPGLKMLPSELFADKKVAVVTSTRPGKYRLLAYTAVADEPSEPVLCVVTIGDPPPVPPPPGPVPPVPPHDPLGAEFVKLYAADTDPKKADALKSLVELYRQCPDLAADSGLKTLGDLLGTIRAAAASLVPATALLPIRRRIADLLGAELGTDASSELTPALRSKAVSMFRRIHTALEGVK